MPSDFGFGYESNGKLALSLKSGGGTDRSWGLGSVCASERFRKGPLEGPGAGMERNGWLIQPRGDGWVSTRDSDSGPGGQVQGDVLFPPQPVLLTSVVTARRLHGTWPKVTKASQAQRSTQSHASARQRLRAPASSSGGACRQAPVSVTTTHLVPWAFPYQMLFFCLRRFLRHIWCFHL